MKVPTILLSLTLSCLCSTSIFALDGSLTYQTTLGVGREVYGFGVDPSDPLRALYGGTLADYASRPKLEGPNWWAQLWYAQGVGKGESDLAPVADSIVEFRTGKTAGLINGKSKLFIPGTLGGDHVTLQLRVWNNQGGTISSWAEALAKFSVTGKSAVIADFVLTGVDASGAPVLGDMSLASKLQYFGTPIPEPSALAAVGFIWMGLLSYCRSRRVN